MSTLTHYFILLTLYVYDAMRVLIITSTLRQLIIHKSKQDTIAFLYIIANCNPQHNEHFMYHFEVFIILNFLQVKTEEMDIHTFSFKLLYNLESLLICLERKSSENARRRLYLLVCFNILLFILKVTLKRCLEVFAWRLGKN